MRKLEFAEKEFYHIYNRGVDKRNIFLNSKDLERFFEGLRRFNSEENFGHLDRIIENKKVHPLVKIIAYCVNPNHFHFILEQVAEKGIEKFMHKLSMGYAKYFNTKYKRGGALFQGMFRAKHIDNNEYLLHLSAYINLNHMAHARRHGVSTLSRASWDEYLGSAHGKALCEKEIILGQFKNKEAYQKFAESSLKSIVERKMLLEELAEAGIELINTR